MKKRIYLNGRFLSQTITGVQRYALELVKALDSMLDDGLIDNEQNSFILIVPHNIKVNLTLKHIAQKKVGNLTGHLWEQIELPLSVNNGLLVNMCNTGPLLVRNQMTTIHDAAVFGFPQAYSFKFRIWYKLLLRGLGFVAKKIVTDSEFSKKELIKYCGVPKEKLQVIYLGKEHVLAIQADDTIIEKYNLKNIKYVLAVSSMNPNKNFHSVVKAIKLIDHEKYTVVIAGGANPTVFGNMDIPRSDNVKYVGYVNDAELRALYEHANCFIYPSFYEGFGLPPLEAMTLGCPVIVSNTASIPEVCGDAALYCEPSNPQDIACKINLLMSNSKLREELWQKSQEQIRLFSWGKCAEKMWTVIKEVYEQ